jgi:hypothetical protein
MDPLIAFRNDKGSTSDIFANLYKFKYAWTDRGVWCGCMDRVVHVDHITHLVVGNEDVCEIQCYNAILEKLVSLEQIILLLRTRTQS